MSGRVRFTPDTNILVYAAHRNAGRRHALASDLVARAVHADCVLTLQCLAEFFNVTIRKNALLASEAIALIKAWRRSFPVITADYEALMDAVGAVQAHQMSFWDAMLWATARQAGCVLLLTEDGQDGRRLGGVTFVNPFGEQIPRSLAVVLDLPN